MSDGDEPARAHRALKAVPAAGTSPLHGVGLRRLVWILAATDFRRRYAETKLGYAWLVIAPILYFGVVYVFVSEVIERFIGTVPHFGALLLLNLVLFNFFREATGVAMRSLSSNGGLVRKLPLPTIALPAAALLSAGFALLANLALALTWLLLDGVEPRWSWLLVVVIVAWLALVTWCLGLLLAGLHVGTRDVAHFWPIMARVLFYASPILYPLDVIQQKILFDALAFNPLAPIFVQARVWLVDPNAPGWFETMGTSLDGLLPFGIVVFVGVMGWMSFRVGSRRAAEDL